MYNNEGKETKFTDHIENEKMTVRQDCKELSSEKCADRERQKQIQEEKRDRYIDRGTRRMREEVKEKEYKRRRET